MPDAKPTHPAHIDGATREQLLSLPHRDYANVTAIYDSLLLLPDGTAHDSGWGVIALIGCRKLCPVEIVGQCADDLEWHILDQFRTDCALPSQALHFWSRTAQFRVDYPLSTTDIYVEPKGRS